MCILSIKSYQHSIITYSYVYTDPHLCDERAEYCQRNLELQTTPEDTTKVLRPMLRGNHLPGGIHVSMKLQGCIVPKKAYNLETLAKYYSLPDLQDLTKIYLIHNAFKSSPDPASDAARLQDSGLEAFHTLQVPVPCFDHD